MIHLAEYSTIFDGIRMSCRIRLFRAFGDSEVKVRVLSGKAENDDATSLRLQYYGNII
jgi:hypothetical protein